MPRLRQNPLYALETVLVKLCSFNDALCYGVIIVVTPIAGIVIGFAAAEWLAGLSR